MAKKRYTVAELVVTVKGDVTSLVNELDKGVSDIKKFSGDMTRVNRDLVKVGAGMTVAAGAIIGAGAAAVKVFADLEQSIANTASVTGDTSRGLKELEAFARKMGRTTIYTATQAGEAMYYLASAGYNAQQIFDGLEGILALAAATQFDLAETTATVVSTLRAFNMEASEASRVANVFAAAISSSQATMFKLSESMKYVAPVFASLDWNIESTVAALSKLYDSGLEASMSGTQLRMAMTRLQKPTRAARQAISDLGVKFNDLDPAANSLVDIIWALEEANAGAAEKGRLMSEIFGVRSKNAMTILVRTGSSALAEMVDNITNTTKAADMQQRQIDTLKGTWRLMTSALQETSIIIGTNLEPALKAIMESIRQLNLSFSALPDFVKTIIVGFTALSAVFLAVGGAVTMIVGNLPRLIEGLTLLRAVAAGLGWQISAVTVGIMALLAAFGYLASAQERQKRLFEENILEMKNAINLRRKEEKAIVNSVKQLEKLVDVQEDNKTLYGQQQRAINRLNSVVPGLVDKNKSLAEQMDKLKDAANEAEKEVEELGDQLERVEGIKLKRTLSENREEIKKLEEDLRTGAGLKDWVNDAKEFKLESSMVPKDWDHLQKTMNGVSKGAFKNILENSKSISILNRGIGVDVSKYRDNMEKIAYDGTTYTNLLEYQDRLSDTRLDAQQKFFELQDKLNNRSESMTSYEAEQLVLLQREYAILKMMDDVTAETVNKVDTIRQLRQENKEIEEGTKPTEEVDGEGGEDEKLARQREALELEIAAYGAKNRREVREKELKKWENTMRNRLHELQMDETELNRVVAIKKKEIEREAAIDIATYEKMVMMKTSKDIFQSKIAELDIWVEQAVERGREVGLSEAESRINAEKAYAAEKLRIERDINQAIEKMSKDVSLELQEARLDSIRNTQERAIAEEQLKYNQEIASAKYALNEETKAVEQGLITKEQVQQNYRSRMEAAEASHTERLRQLNYDYTMQVENDRATLAARIKEIQAKTDTSSLYQRDIEMLRAANIEKLNSVDQYYAQLMEKYVGDEETIIDLEKKHNAEREAAKDELNDNILALQVEYEVRRLEIELAGLDKDDRMYKKRLEQHKEFLENKLEQMKTYGEGREEVEEELNATEEDLEDQRKRREKRIEKHAAKTFELIEKAAVASSVGQADAWREAAKEYIALQAASLKGEIILKLAKDTASFNWFGVAKWTAAYAAVTAAEHAAYALLGKRQRPTAAYGGEIESGGEAWVHPGEWIFPRGVVNELKGANITRKPWHEYRNTMAEGLNLPISSNPMANAGAVGGTNEVIKQQERTVNIKFEIDANGAIITPANVDEQDAFYERIIKPAEERFKEAIGEMEKN